MKPAKRFHRILPLLLDEMAKIALL